MIKSAGGEEFDTGAAQHLWAVFDRAFLEQPVGSQTVETRKPMLTCRTSDVAAHSLVKQSVIRRVADDKSYRVVRFEDDGTGVTVVVLAV